MTCPLCSTRPAKRRCPALGPVDLPGVLRHQAPGRDPVSRRLRVPGVGAPTPRRVGAASARARRRADAAGDDRLHRSAVALLLPVPVDRAAAPERPVAPAARRRRRRGRGGRPPRRSKPRRAVVIYEQSAGDVERAGAVGGVPARVRRDRRSRCRVRGRRSNETPPGRCAGSRRRRGGWGRSSATRERDFWRSSSGCWGRRRLRGPGGAAPGTDRRSSCRSRSVAPGLRLLRRTAGLL